MRKLDAHRVGEHDARLPHELVLDVSVARQGVPEVERVGDGEPGRGVDGAGPVELRGEAPAPAVAHGEGAHARGAVAPALPEVEHRRPAGGAGPLVEVPREEVRTQSPEVQREHTGGVGPVHEHGHPRRAGQRHDALHRVDVGRRRAHRVHDHQARTRRETAFKRLDGPIVGRPEERHVHLDAPHPVALLQRPHGLAHGVVALVGQNDLVPCVPVHAREHRRHSRGGVRHERDALRVRAEPRRYACPHPLEQGGEPPREKVHGLRLQLPAPARLGGLHGAGHRPEAPVVQEGSLRVEVPEGAEFGGAGGEHGGRLTPPHRAQASP